MVITIIPSREYVPDFAIRAPDSPGHELRSGCYEMVTARAWLLICDGPDAPAVWHSNGAAQDGHPVIAFLNKTTVGRCRMLELVGMKTELPVRFPST